MVVDYLGLALPDLNPRLNPSPNLNPALNPSLNPSLNHDQKFLNPYLLQKAEAIALDLSDLGLKTTDCTRMP